MHQKPKAFTFIGFAVRARKIKCGVNAAELSKERIRVLLLCSSAQKNTVKEANKLSRKNRCPLICVHGELLENLVNKTNCKLAGITDPALAQAVVDNADGEYLIIFGGSSI